MLRSLSDCEMRSIDGECVRAHGASEQANLKRSIRRQQLLSAIADSSPKRQKVRVCWCVCAVLIEREWVCRCFDGRSAMSLIFERVVVSLCVCAVP